MANSTPSACWTAIGRCAAGDSCPSSVRRSPSGWTSSSTIVSPALKLTDRTTAVPRASAGSASSAESDSNSASSASTRSQVSAALAASVTLAGHRLGRQCCPQLLDQGLILFLAFIHAMSSAKIRLLHVQLAP